MDDPRRGGAGGGGGPERVRVAVCVATYRRPERLVQLLESVARLRFRKHPMVDVRVVVVDNDADGSARAVAEAARTWLGWPLEYVVEGERGISFARNRAAALALSQGADFVAYVDDDEIVGEAWLDELIDVQRRYQADIVGGPVLPRYEPGTPDWVARGRFFEHPRYATGTRVAYAATNNVLIAAHILEGPDGGFDAGFALTGGEDTQFFMRARERGARMVWADGAVVGDAVPRSRTTARWILQRHFREGNSIVWCERSVLSGRAWLPWRLAKAVGRIGQGTLMLPVAPLRGRAGVVTALCHVLRGVGSLSALWGVRYQEYGRKQGGGTVPSGSRQ